MTGRGTPNDTISEGIAAAQARSANGENGLNLPFSRKSVVSMYERCNLNPNMDTFVHLRNAVAVFLGYDEWNPRRRATYTINMRIKDESTVQFLIVHVQDMCKRAGIDPNTQDRATLSKWILSQVV